MRAKEALLKNFFANVEVVQRTRKVAAAPQRWEVRRRPACCTGGGLGGGALTCGARARRCQRRLPPWPARVSGTQVPLLPGGRAHRAPPHPRLIGPEQEEERQLQRELDAAQRRVHEALCDNINTQVGGGVGWIEIPPGGVCAGRVAGCGSRWRRAGASDAPAPCRSAHPPSAGRHGRAVRPGQGLPALDDSPAWPSSPSPATQAAMGALCDLVKAVNIYLAARADAGGPQPQALLLRAAAAYVTRILSVFGLAASPGDFLGFAEPGAAGGADDEAMHAVLDDLCSFRCGMDCVCAVTFMFLRPRGRVPCTPCWTTCARPGAPGARCAALRTPWFAHLYRARWEAPAASRPGPLPQCLGAHPAL